MFEEAFKMNVLNSYGSMASLIVRRNDENLMITYWEEARFQVNQALIKLSEFMKRSLDSLHKRYGYYPTSETIGIIID
ncbi:13926_t:CDS:2, partial [Acaulospora morrowiae]